MVGREGVLVWQGRLLLRRRGGVDSCAGKEEPYDISEWYSLEEYFRPVGEYGNMGYSREVGGFRAMYLPQRLWACHDAAAIGDIFWDRRGNGVECKYTLEETKRLALAVAKRKMFRLGDMAWCSISPQLEKWGSS